MISLNVINLAEARFECTFGRGCEGICCHNGRPGLEPEEIKRIEKNLPKVLPHLRPEARQVIERDGFMTNRIKYGQRTARVVGGWCIFFNEGCVLHKVGAAEGDSFKYKPSICALFPLNQLDENRWYVRQQGFRGEAWDLFCLAPKKTTPLVTDSCKEELALAAKIQATLDRKRKKKPRKKARVGSS